MRKDLIIKISATYKKFSNTQILDISKFEMEVAPTAHYSMARYCCVSRKSSNNIKIFSAVEEATGMDCTNRLVGNSIA